MTVHPLKTIYPWFDDIWEGRKDFEVRIDDRIDEEGSFKIGDILLLREWNDSYIPGMKYTGRQIRAVVGYITRLNFLCSVRAPQHGFPVVAMGLKHIQCSTDGERV